MAFTNFAGMSIDLLAQIAGGSDASKKKIVDDLLRNSVNNLFDQLHGPLAAKFTGQLACGSILEEAGQKLFGKSGIHLVPYFPYHILFNTKKLPVTLSWDDVKYKESALQLATQALKKFLAASIAIRVGAVDGPGPGMIASSNGALQPNRSGGHFLLIVGCNDAATQFLYIDPWPSGSILAYTGGDITKPYVDKCNYLGLLEFKKVTSSTRGPTLRKISPEGSFGFDLEIMAGPMHYPS